MGFLFGTPKINVPTPSPAALPPILANPLLWIQGAQARAKASAGTGATAATLSKPATTAPGNLLGS